MADDNEFSDVPADAGNGELAEVWNGLAADQPAPEQARPVIEPPTSWPNERKARWSSFSPDDQAYIAAREKEAHTRITSQGQELARLRAEYEAASSNGARYGELQQHLADLEAKYEGQLAQVAQRDNRAEYDKFAQGKAYCNDPEFQRALANEMRSLVAEVPGLKGTMLLRLAHDRLAERVGIPQRLAQMRDAEQKRLDAERQAQQQQRQQEQQQREQEMQQRLAERDAQWQRAIAQRDAEQFKQQQEREAQRQREAIQHTRRAKRAAIVNTRGSPGHGTNPKTMDDTLKEIASRHYN